MTLATASGKTAHLINRKLGTHKGAGRLWFEGKRLVDIGFTAGVRYQVVATPGESLVLRLSARLNPRPRAVSLAALAAWLSEARRRWVLVATSGRAFDASALVPGERPAALGAAIAASVR